MSDLKHKTVRQLKEAKVDCESYIGKLRSSLNGQEQRLGWIETYLFEKTPQELSIQQIEQKLGHKIIIKGRRK